MKVFAKRFYGFDPATRPLIAFGIEGNRDALITASSPGDLIVFVGTQGEPTAEHERGRLLGLAEFARVAVDTADLTDPTTLRPIDLKPDGSYTWPKGLPIVRAWLFPEPRFKLIDILKEQLTFEATVRAVLLDDEDARAVLAIPRQEVSLPENPVRSRLLAINNTFVAGRPTTGPMPAEWTRLVSRDAGQEAWTYAFRFGRRSLWKVGHAQDVRERLAQMNEHVPSEELGEHWSLVMHQRWPSSQHAYGMEQRVFRALQHRRTQGERIRCSEAELQEAWVCAIASLGTDEATLQPGLLGRR